MNILPSKCLKITKNVSSDFSCQNLIFQWDGKSIYNFAYQRDIDTDFGICCWFTPQLQDLTQVKAHQDAENQDEPDWGLWMGNVPKGVHSGKKNGYKMILDLETFDYTYLDANSEEEGLKLSLVHFLDIPIVTHSSIDIPSGSRNQIEIKPTLISTSQNAIERFAPKDRDCYTDQEVHLKYLPKNYGYRYAMHNCYFQSTLEMIMTTCQCFPTFHPIVKEVSEEKFNDCTTQNSYKCANQILHQFGQHNYIHFNEEKMKCLPSCEDQTNEINSAISNIKISKSLLKQEEFCILTQRLVEKCSSGSHKKNGLNQKYEGLCETIEPLKNVQFCSSNLWNMSEIPNCTVKKCPIEDVILDYAVDNLVLINMYIDDFHVTRFIKDEKMTRTSFIFAVAMILVVCLGWSIVTIAELLFLLFDTTSRITYAIKLPSL